MLPVILKGSQLTRQNAFESVLVEVFHGQAAVVRFFQAERNILERKIFDTKTMSTEFGSSTLFFTDNWLYNCLGYMLPAVSFLFQNSLTTKTMIILYYER